MFPLPAQLALALVLLKSKPSNLSVEDYIHGLRSTIVASSKQEQYSLVQADAALFWKQAYESAEEEKSRLEDRLFEIEESQSRAVVGKSTRKRKQSSMATKANIQSKRIRIESEDKEINLENECADSEDQQSDSLTILLRAIRMVGSEQHRGFTSVPNRIAAACSCMLKAIKSCETISHSNPDLDSGASFSSVCRATKQLWIVTLQAMQKIEDVSETSNCLPYLVSEFQSVLGHLHQQCFKEAQRRAENSNRSTEKSKSNTAALKNDWREKSMLSKTICQDLTTMAADMISVPSLLDVMQGELLEGLMCAFLDHLGSSLSLSVFGDSNAGGQNQVGLLPPRGIVDLADIEVSLGIATTHVEAPYLIFILRAALRTMDKHQTTVPSKSDSISTASMNLKSQLSIKLHEKLQNTLLRAIFGDDEETFKNILKRMDRVEVPEWDDLKSSCKSEKESSDWFSSQVWENIGWDILMKQSE